MTELTGYLEKHLGATGVYIGKLEQSWKAIKEDDNEKAHLTEDAVEVIKFKHANKSHEEVMVGAELKPE